MSTRAAFVNHLWQLSARAEARRFRRASGEVAETQRRLLQGYLRRNRQTAFGRLHDFASLSPERYPARVPLSTYDDYPAWIGRIADGEAQLLTAERVQLFELSSGSSAATKMIPYTATLKAEFQRGLAPWIADLYARYPQLKDGPAYWSITPLVDGRRCTPGGIPIGFEQDSAYLGPLGALLESALAVPNAVKQIRDVDDFRYVSLLFLLREAQLRLISVWNPTFLSLLLAALPACWERLLADIAAGSVSPPGGLDPALGRALAKKLRPDPARARRLAGLGPDDYAAIWPQLGLISCWADGPSAPYAQALARVFPGVVLQPKGLLATEAFVSFPLVGQEGGVLAVSSHFFEFLDENGEARLAHQLEKGRAYRVVVTTGGGLYRYQLQDVVEVIGFVAQAPRLRFVGRADLVSDWFGEKLNERFVAGVLERLFRRHALAPAFAMLAPDDSAAFRYTLYLDLASGRSPAELCGELDAALSENFHYAYCRKLGQLAAPGVMLVANGMEAYLRACQARGQKLGNIKPSLLQKSTGWGDWLGGAA